MTISDIQPYPQNAKKHDKKQIDQIANSIKAFGMNQPIVVDTKGVIIVGHGRYYACKQLGIEPDIKIVELTEEQANAYRLADNKLNESEWDMKLVIPELRGLSEEMFNLTGFDKDLLIEPDAKDDVIPENVPARSKLGDLYELGQHRVLCGDSTQEEAVFRIMDGKKVDMVFTDPPYNFEGKGAGFLKKITSNMRERVKDIIDFEPSSISFMKELPTNTFLFFCNKALVPIYLSLFKEFDFNILVWCKNNPTPFTSNNFLPDLEYLLLFTRKGRIWNNSLHPTSVYSKFYTSSNLEGRTDVGNVHPTIKPVKILEDKVRVCSSPRGIVLDPFLGSGSTLIASEKTGRVCYGIELDPKYVDVIVQRYIDYVDDPVIKCNGEDVTNLWKKTL